MKLPDTCKHTKPDTPIPYTVGGFTYIELLLALSLVGVLLGMGALIDGNALTRNELIHERDVFVGTVLGHLRIDALANTNGMNHGVFIDNEHHRYVLFMGDSYVPDDAHTRVIPFHSHMTRITHDTENTTIIFEARTGRVISGTGTYTLSDRTHAQIVSLNAVGQINW